MRGGIYGKGLFTYIVGDSSTGKTWLLLSELAEAARNDNFDGYRFYYDAAERGNRMNVRRYFGATVEECIEAPPRGVSSTIEDFYYNLQDACDAGPCLYLLDSMDALDAQDDQKKFDANSDLHRKGKKPETGSYGMAKAKSNSINMRRVPHMLAANGCGLTVISQTRDNTGMGFSEKTRSGGKSLDFYSDVQIWTSVREKVKKEIMGKKRHVATRVKVVVRKNRINGWEGETEFTFLKNYGIDNTGSSIEYVIEEGGWKVSNGRIDASPEFPAGMTKAKLIDYIETEQLHARLYKAVKRTWKAVELATTPKRSPRYE